ncbi:MAG: ATP-binding protein [Chloroflexota bacterium]
MEKANQRSVKKVTFSFLLIAGLWVAYSDWILLKFVPQAEEYAYLQTIKGVLFLIVSSALLYWLLSREMTRSEALSKKARSAESAALEIAHKAAEERKELYEEALRQKNIFEQIFTHSAVAMKIIDENGYCERVNPKFCELYSVAPQDVEGRLNVYEEPESVFRGLDLLIKQVFRDGAAVEIETEYDLGRGHRHIGIENSKRGLMWISLQIYPILNFEGKPKRVIVLSQDITERKQYFEAMNKSISLYTAIAKNIPNGSIMLFDKDYRYTFASGAGFDLINKAPDYYVGKTLWDVAPKESAQTLASMYGRAFLGETSYGEIEYFSRTFAVTITPVKSSDGEIEMGLLLTQDITDKKRYRDQLAQMNADLERRVTERTLQLENTAIELEHEIEEHKKTEAQLLVAQRELADKLAREKELHTLKSRFVSMVSHEYRAPLTIIQTSAYLLREYLKRDKPESVETQIMRIESASVSMLKLLEDVLMIGRTEDSKTLVRSPIDLVRFARDVATDLKESHHADIRLEFKSNKPEIIFLAHELSLRQVLINLVSNAIKYSPAASVVTIEVNDNADHVEIRVNDCGIGIPERDREKLFEPFHRAQNVGARPGTGLGLAIVQKCVKLLRGSIEFASREGEGSSFIVLLPKETDL